MRKYAMVRDILSTGNTFTFVQADFASPDVIRLAHDPDYVDRFLAGTLDRTVIRRIGFPWSPGLVRRTLASVGGSLAAAEDAMRHGWGGNLAGGTHHAFYGEGSGFCVFNDIAVIIRNLFAQGRIGRAAVLDLDVHQGDGTALLFEQDPAVLTVSMHGKNNFPFRKQKSSLDIELADGTGDDEYQQRLTEALASVVAFKPDVIVYQSGVDGLTTDSLGRLALTPEGLATRDRLVFTACRELGCPVVVTLGGGYSNPLEITALAHAATYRLAHAILGADGHRPMLL